MNATPTKEFHLGDVLTITTGKLMSPRHMDGVYEILNFMTDDNLMTHQLPRAMRECAPHLLKQHPQLENIQMGEVTPANFKQVLEDLCAQYGETMLVAKVPQDAHEFIDPVSELAEKVHPSKIIVVNVDDVTK